MKNSNDMLGEKAKAAAASLHTDNEARKKHTDRLRALVTVVRQLYIKGKELNGQKTWTDWCRWACPNPGTKDPTRWFQKVLGQRKEKDPNAVRVSKLTDDQIVSFELADENDKHFIAKFRISLPEGVGEFGGTKRDRRKIRGNIHIEMIEEPTKSVTKEKIAAVYLDLTKEELDAPMTNEVVEAKKSTRKKKSNRKPKTHALNTRFPVLGKTWCGKNKTEKLAEEGKKPTCKTCARLQHENRPAAEVLADFRKRQAAKKKQATHAAMPTPAYSRRLHKDCVFSYCGKNSAVRNVNFAKDGEEPTCEKCLRQIALKKLRAGDTEKVAVIVAPDCPPAKIIKLTVTNETREIPTKVEEVL